jgi:cytochrome c oxidase subunit 2
MFALVITASIMAVVFSITKAMEEPENAEEPVAENELRITGKSFEFNQPEYHVAAGQEIIISYKNELGGGIHGMAINGTDINLKDGEKAAYTFEPGVYNIVCTIMCGTGHAEMTSKLIVE